MGLNLSRLSRNFEEEPVIWKNHTIGFENKPTREDLYYLYIEENLSIEEIGNFFNIKPATIYLWIRKNGIKKAVQRRNQAREDSCIKKYGFRNVSQIEEIKNKKVESQISHFGKIMDWSNPEVYNKFINKLKVEYGVNNVSKVEEYWSKAKKSWKKKYGVDNPSKSKVIQNKKLASKEYSNEKRYKTKRLNGTFNTSSSEENLRKFLLGKFPDLKTQYRDKRYPFACDFYIPSLDLFIEYQGNWTHGGEPYIGTEFQLKVVEDWLRRSKELNFKGKYKEFYKSAVYDWTVRDVEKRKIAKENNLNWVEFFNEENFKEYFINGV